MARYASDATRGSSDGGFKTAGEFWAAGRLDSWMRPTRSLPRLIANGKGTPGQRESWRTRGVRFRWSFVGCPTVQRETTDHDGLLLPLEYRPSLSKTIHSSSIARSMA